MSFYNVVLKEKNGLGRSSLYPNLKFEHKTLNGAVLLNI